MQSGIYMIENSLNGKFYVGSAVNLKGRINNHRTRLNCNIHKNAHLQAAWSKYGAENFTFRTLLICKPDDLLFYEQRALDSFKAVECGYNIAPIAGNTRGRANNPERNAKMAATKRGRKQTPEHLAARIAGMNKPESKARMAAGVSAALKGKPKTAEHIRNAANAQRGKTISEETREKIRASLIGRKSTKPRSHKGKPSWTRGRPLTLEHCEALKAAWARRKQAAA